jgi:hypothetical protein
VQFSTNTDKQARLRSTRILWERDLGPSVNDNCTKRNFSKEMGTKIDWIGQRKEHGCGNVDKSILKKEARVGQEV